MIYHAGLSANYCICKVMVNGLGVTTVNAEKVGSTQYPCNTELIGKENTVAIEVMPASPDLGALDKVNVQGYVKRYSPDEITGPESGELLMAFNLEQKIAELKANPFAVNLGEVFPFTLTGTFDSEDVPSFRNRLVDADVIANKAELLNWGMNFKRMLEKQDVAALYEQYEPKLIDYDIAYPEDKEPDNLEWFSDWMTEKIFPQIPVTDFTMDDINCVKWCDGRIWELQLKDGGPLWRTIGKDGKRTKVQVFVGLINNAIKIIR